VISRLAAPQFLLAATAASCAVLVLGPLESTELEPLLLLLLPGVAFLAGRAPARSAGALSVGLLLAGIAASQMIKYEDNSIVPEIMLPVTLYLAGLALRSRETLAGQLVEQAGELETERDAYARLSVRYERARIAGELHDVVAHAISVMVVQASAGQRLAVSEPSRAAETFDVIATASRQAEADLDRLADLLAQDTTGDERADLSLVRELVDTARASGLPVTLRISGDTSGVSSAVAHAALRVVQEGLTNALRYAPGALAEVAVEARPGALELSIVNGHTKRPAGLGLGSGRGLIGLRERVGAFGGTLDAGPDGEGGWSVRARIAC
jgi:signal transduction histidine kinase